jgi:phosphatidylinositol glycan class V
MGRLPQSYRVHTTLFPPSLIPHAIHALILTGTLLFASHTQIVLRLAPSMPLIYWAAAAAIVRDAEPTAQEGASPATTKVRWSYVWVWWSVVWGALSVVLWTAFLPPA